MSTPDLGALLEEMEEFVRLTDRSVHSNTRMLAGITAHWAKHMKAALAACSAAPRTPAPDLVYRLREEADGFERRGEHVYINRISKLLREAADALEDR